MKIKRLFNLNKILLFNIFFIIIFNSCSIFNKKEIKINNNLFSGEKIYFSELDKDYKKLKNFNRVWSRLNSKKFKSYHKYLNKNFTIIGQTNISGEDFLIIKNRKDKIYKAAIKLDNKGVLILPSYLILKNDLDNATELIGKNIWLNYIDDIEIFFTYSDHNFSRFSMVEVVDLIKFQDGEKYLPLWLKVKNKVGFEGFLRYGTSQDNIGFQDHYFIDDPLPEIWGERMIKLILKGEVELGMNEKQLRRSIGNPNIINKTSSRHGISEQWVYSSINSSDIYYQFEYGKLVYVSH